MSRVLITGGVGFQGGHLARHWAQAGHEVTVLNTPSPRARQRYQTEMQYWNWPVRAVWGSVTDPEVVGKAVEDQDVVVHLAAVANPDQTIAAPVQCVSVNVRGTGMVLEAVRRTGCRLIYGSSCEVYGSLRPGQSEQTEDSPFFPSTPYAASKAAADRLCWAWGQTFGLRVTIVRPCNVFGPWQAVGPHGGVIPNFVRAMLRQEPLRIRGTGDQWREYLAIDDLVQGYDLALHEARIGVLNLGSGQLIPIREIAEWLQRRYGARIEHTAARAGDVTGFRLGWALAKEYGFLPQVDFWKGLEEYVDWARTAGRHTWEG